MTGSDPGPDAKFVDVGPPLSPSQAGLLESVLEQRGIALRLRICDRGADGRDRQAVQVADADLAAALEARSALFPAPAAPPTPPKKRSNRLRAAALAGFLGLFLSLRIVRYVPVPKGSLTALVVFAVGATCFAAAFGFTKDPPGGGP